MCFGCFCLTAGSLRGYGGFSFPQRGRAECCCGKYLLDCRNGCKGKDFMQANSYKTTPWLMRFLQNGATNTLSTTFWSLPSDNDTSQPTSQNSLSYWILFHLFAVCNSFSIRMLIDLCHPSSASSDTVRGL